MSASPATSSSSASTSPATGATQGQVEPLVLTPEQVRESFPAVMGFLQSYFSCQALRAVVSLQVPDAIGSGCCTVDDLVGRIDDTAAASRDGGGGGGDTKRADPTIRTEALYRCLRLLAARGFFEESAHPEDGSAMYRLTPMGALLQTNVMVGDGPTATAVQRPPSSRRWRAGCST
jgi:hypothetical protein